MRKTRTQEVYLVQEGYLVQLCVRGVDERGANQSLELDCEEATESRKVDSGEPGGST